jgi:hypothetical protein
MLLPATPVRNICQIRQPAPQSKLRELRQRARSACFVPLLSMKTPVFVDRQYQNQLLSMKSWVLVDRI